MTGLTKKESVLIINKMIQFNDKSISAFLDETALNIIFANGFV